MIGVEVYHGYYRGGAVALRIDNTHPLVIGCISFQCIARTTGILEITFIIVDLTVQHDILHFALRYLPALHTTSCMVAVLQQRCTSLKAPFVRRSRVFGLIICYGGDLLVLPGFYDYDRCRHDQDQDVGKPFILHTQMFG